MPALEATSTLGRPQGGGRAPEVVPEVRRLLFEALDEGARRLHDLRESSATVLLESSSTLAPSVGHAASIYPRSPCRITFGPEG